MKKDNKKALYEAIMTSVAKEVKKVLNESFDEMDKLRIELEFLLKKIRGRKFTFDEPFILHVTETSLENIDKDGEMQDAYDREITQNIFDWFDDDLWDFGDGDGDQKEERIEDIQRLINVLHKGLY